MNKKVKNGLELLGIYGSLLLMIVVISYPLLWTFGLSLNPGVSLYGASMIPENWSFDHYIWLFTDPSSDYLLWYKNTLIVAVSTSIGALVFVTFVAYAFSRYRFVGRKNGLYAFLLLQMFPVLMAMVAVYLLLNMIGLLDSLAGWY